jgi:pimeloyl-ACP methyl ester carboxylesterase
MEPLFRDRQRWRRIYVDLPGRGETPGPKWLTTNDRLVRPLVRPALFVLGRQDSVTGYRSAWSMLESYPRATFAVLDRAGHALAYEQAPLFNALARDWLDRVEEAWS